MGSAPSTVLYILNGSSMGGANRSLSVLLAGLDRSRFRPLALLPTRGPFVERLRQLEVPARFMTLPWLGRYNAQLSGHLKRAVRNTRNMHRIRRLMKEQKVRLVHTNTIFPLGGALAAKISSLPHVWHLREGLDTPQYNLRFGRAASRFLIAALSDRMICISDYVRRTSVPPKAASRAVVIPNALEEIPPLHIRGSPTSPVVGAVGLIGSKKRTRLFVEAAASIARAFPEARFIVVGEPTAGEESLLEACRARVSELGLEKRFEWTGFLPDPRPLYDRMDLLLHPGVHEAFGRVLIEAMARGIPVVSVDSGAVPEVVENNLSGLIVPADDLERFAAAAVKCLSDAELYAALARGARSRTVGRFQAAEHVHRVEEVYEDLLKEEGRWSQGTMPGSPSSGSLK